MAALARAVAPSLRAASRSGAVRTKPLARFMHWEQGQTVSPLRRALLYLPGVHGHSHELSLACCGEGTTAHSSTPLAGSLIVPCQRKTMLVLSLCLFVERVLMPGFHV